MNPNQKDAVISLFEDIRQGIGILQCGIECALPFEEHGAIIHREHVLNALKSIIASANTGVESLQEQSKKIELTTEEQQMLDGIRKQQQAIFARMTPELVAFTLRSIAEAIEEVDDIQWQDDVDIIHLRQIADWLEVSISSKEQAK